MLAGRPLYRAADLLLILAYSLCSQDSRFSRGQRCTSRLFGLPSRDLGSSRHRVCLFFSYSHAAAGLTFIWSFTLSHCVRRTVAMRAALPQTSTAALCLHPPLRVAAHRRALCSSSGRVPPPAGYALPRAPSSLPTPFHFNPYSRRAAPAHLFCALLTRRRTRRSAACTVRLIICSAPRRRMHWAPRYQAACAAAPRAPVCARMFFCQFSRISLYIHVFISAARRTNCTRGYYDGLTVALDGYRRRAVLGCDVLFFFFFFFFFFALDGGIRGINGAATACNVLKNGCGLLW